MRLKLVPENTSINFLKFYRLAFILSSLLVVGSIGLFAIIGLNLGIDFKGGTLIELRANNVDASKIRSELNIMNFVNEYTESVDPRMKDSIIYQGVFKKGKKWIFHFFFNVILKWPKGFLRD